jgi:hypothetical protein
MLLFAGVVENEWRNGECGVMLPNEFDDLNIRERLSEEERE